ncbi:hypothetical protein NEFER03_1320 [Nematocida sp. LUAm3]|nr:hypothetical protein NEFER03_1320 [Nematocida sp. LUAm3]KAI5174058.1 hypothetical protein NEFER02_0525 [Nematocida sp. LUAm2]KAI5177199.1 hypothetical protein NEFER01_0474 [Nematocida sp. LUAm1]
MNRLFIIKQLYICIMCFVALSVFVNHVRMLWYRSWRKQVSFLSLAYIFFMVVYWIILENMPIYKNCDNAEKYAEPTLLMCLPRLFLFFLFSRGIWALEMKEWIGFLGYIDKVLKDVLLSVFIVYLGKGVENGVFSFSIVLFTFFLLTFLIMMGSISSIAKGLVSFRRKRTPLADNALREKIQNSLKDLNLGNFEIFVLNNSYSAMDINIHIVPEGVSLLIVLEKNVLQCFLSSEVLCEVILHHVIEWQKGHLYILEGGNACCVFLIRLVYISGYFRGTVGEVPLFYMHVILLIFCSALMILGKCILAYVSVLFEKRILKEVKKRILPSSIYYKLYLEEYSIEQRTGIYGLDVFYAYTKKERENDL